MIADTLPCGFLNLRLHLGPNGGRGKWSPGSDTQDAKLEAIPYTTPRGVTIYTATFDLSRGDTPPVVLQRDSQDRVRGNLASSHSVYFGVTVRQADGEFAGRFQTVRPADEFPAGRDFEVVLSLQDYQLDPSLDDMKDKLPRVPFELVVESIWCHTLDQPAGLEIFEIELLSATASSTADQPTAQPPTVDIWTAASQGNLAAVRRHIASGADLNATVSAPGIPASGATPLHLSVLADRGEIAEVLIAGGADLGARAQDEHGGTPLHWAAALGRIEMAKRLVRLGADVNAPDSNGYTPLDATDYAPEYEPEAKARIAEFLREKGGVTK